MYLLAYMSKTNEHLQYREAGRIRKRSEHSATKSQLIAHFVVTLRPINTNMSYFSCHQALSLHNSGKMIFLEKERLRLQPSASPLRAEPRFKEVSGQLAPGWAIRPGQLAPDL